jgi:4-amino-4-deoxy-L-arabinose transferase-like glycosyltransferase
MHYTSVTWQMFVSHHFLFPIQNNIPYSDKPPLLFWLAQLSWFIFGVNHLSLILIPTLFALATIYILSKLVQLLFPNKPSMMYIAPLILFGMGGWFLEIPQYRFDIPLTFFVILTTYFNIKAAKYGKQYWLLMSASLFLGCMMKGPIIFLFALPIGLSFIFWKNNFAPQKKSYYKSYFAALIFSVLLTACWLIPTIYFAGKTYATQILINQSSARIVGKYGHAPFYYYIVTIIYMCLPWTLWTKFWRDLFRHIKNKNWNENIKFVLLTFIPAIILLSFIAQKASRYIIPLMPFIAIFVAYILDNSYKFVKKDNIVIAILFASIGAILLFIFPMITVKQPLIKTINFWPIIIIAFAASVCIFRYANNLFKSIAIITIGSTLIIIFGTFSAYSMIRKYDNTINFSKDLYLLQQKNVPLASATPDVSLFEFYGKMPNPINLINTNEINSWLQQSPNGCVITRKKNPDLRSVPKYTLNCPQHPENNTSTFIYR